MKKRPTILVSMGVVLALMAVAAPLQIIIVEPSGLNPLFVISKLSTFQWLIMVLSLAASAMVLRASYWVRVLLPILTLIILGHHLHRWLNHDFSLIQASLLTVGFLALNVPLLHPRVFRLMNFPDRRWWRTSERKRADLAIYLGGCLKGEMRSRTFEISETAAFVMFPAGPRPTFQINEAVSVCLTLGVLNQIRCTGRVVRVTEAKGTYPAGVAIELTSLPWSSKRDIRRFIYQE